MDDVEIISHGGNVKYYKGRWQILANQTGNYVARRPQKFGAKLWCYLETVNGNVIKVLDLPIHKSRNRACDEAWHLQSAIDRISGNPQILSIKNVDEDNLLFEFFSPIPQWSQRYLDALGTRQNTSGCLFSYIIPSTVFEEVERFFEEMLWIKLNRS